MGKKMNQASVKISKDVDNKRQLNSLIKVLRPKVYITDSSSFKRLVQELTGNGNGNPISSSPPAPPPPPSTAPPPAPPPNSVPFIEYHDENYQFFQESSLELSVDSTSELLSTPAPFTAISQSRSNYSRLRDLESWLLEIDHQFPDYTADHKEVCVYDYDLSGSM